MAGPFDMFPFAMFHPTLCMAVACNATLVFIGFPAEDITTWQGNHLEQSDGSGIELPPGLFMAQVVLQTQGKTFAAYCGILSEDQAAYLKEAQMAYNALDQEARVKFRRRYIPDIVVIEIATRLREKGFVMPASGPFASGATPAGDQWN